jgi:hypothetical protein
MTQKSMNQKSNSTILPQARPDRDDQLARRGGWHRQGTDQAGLAGPVSRKLVSRAVTPRKTGKRWSALSGPVWSPMMRWWPGAPARNRRLRQYLGKEEVAALLGHLDRLTDTAAKTLDVEKDLN